MQLLLAKKMWGFLEGQKKTSIGVTEADFLWGYWHKTHVFKTQTGHFWKLVG